MTFGKTTIYLVRETGYEKKTKQENWSRKFLLEKIWTLLTVNNKITSDFKEKFEYILLDKHTLSNNVTLHDQTFRNETHYIRLCFFIIITVYYFLYCFLYILKFAIKIDNR